jgi:hypothetical protein
MPRPRRVAEKVANSYRLETLDGGEIEGLFSSRRLRSLEPKEGTKLFEEQRAFESKMMEAEKNDVPMHVDAVVEGLEY